MELTRNPALIRLGREIMRRRYALGLTLEQLAKHVGLSPTYIGMLEYGRTNPSISSILTITCALDIKLDELFGPVTDLNPSAIELVTLFELASPQTQKAVLALMKARRSPPEGDPPPSSEPPTCS